MFFGGCAKNYLTILFLQDKVIIIHMKPTESESQISIIQGRIFLKGKHFKMCR